jgi:hypothetical protein
MDFMATGFCLKAFQPSRWDSFRFAGNPALKRRAISRLSLAGQNNCAQKFSLRRGRVLKRITSDGGKTPPSNQDKKHQKTLTKI